MPTSINETIGFWFFLFFFFAYIFVLIMFTSNGNIIVFNPLRNNQSEITCKILQVQRIYGIADFYADLYF